MLHGGEIYNSIKVHQDFSININPLGIPETVSRRLCENISLLTQYPDQECRALRASLEKYTGIPARQILCGNGASELIGAAVRGLRVRSVLLTAPSFSGYGHAARAAEAEIRWHVLKREEDFALTDRYLDDLARCPDMAILCSPANPVGNRIDRSLFLHIAEICERQGTWLIADECFLGFLPDEQETTMRRLLLPPRSHHRLLVLDAFTKRFAIPGVRLGYLMAADPEVLERIHVQQPEWSVSVPAQIAGAAALEADPQYLKTAREMIASERKRMTQAMENMGFKVFPGEANYIFFSSEKELYHPLLDRGILIRNCDNYRGLKKGDYRTAVLRPEENDILLRTLTEIVQA